MINPAWMIRMKKIEGAVPSVKIKILAKEWLKNIGELYVVEESKLEKQGRQPVIMIARGKLFKKFD